MPACVRACGERVRVSQCGRRRASVACVFLVRVGCLTCVSASRRAAEERRRAGGCWLHRPAGEVHQWHHTRDPSSTALAPSVPTTPHRKQRKHAEGHSRDEECRLPVQRDRARGPTTDRQERRHGTNVTTRPRRHPHALTHPTQHTTNKHTTIRATPKTSVLDAACMTPCNCVCHRRGPRGERSLLAGRQTTHCASRPVAFVSTLSPSGTRGHEQ